MGRLSRKQRCSASGKKTFEHKIDAVAAASTATRKGSSSSIRIYACTSCGGWHMTKAPLADGGRRS